ncbi:MAG TPA: ZIP family metal transporter [Pirellula sp.]|nr:ZIP family metal transporter [Pirellula sp.]
MFFQVSRDTILVPPSVLLIGYCIFIAAASLAGGKLSSLLRMTHLRTQLLMSGVGGLMIGIALLHLLPHGGEVLGSYSQAGVGSLIGLTVMFLLIRLFHTHDHSVLLTEKDAETECASGNDRQHVGCQDGPTYHDHSAAKGISWAGLFFGLLLHTLVDGVALASSVMADASHGAWLGLAGLGTFLAVLLHKPLDAFAITSVMSKQNWPKAAQNGANVGFSLACPAGALAFYFGATSFAPGSSILGWGLTISAGFFIGIALADLLPEVAFHDHDRVKLTATFLLGIAIAVGIENLPGHSHSHDEQKGSETIDPLLERNHPDHTH